MTDKFNPAGEETAPGTTSPTQKNNAMNYIKQLQTENQDLRTNLQEIDREITALLTYYTGQKFQGIQNDFAHTSTDIVPRLYELRGKITNDLNPAK